MKHAIEFANLEVRMARSILMNELFNISIIKVLVKNSRFLTNLSKTQLPNEIIVPSWKWCNVCYLIAILTINSR